MNTKAYFPRAYKLFKYTITLRMGEYEHCWTYYCKAFELQTAWDIARKSLLDRSYWDPNELRIDKDDHSVFWTPGDEAWLRIDYVLEVDHIDLENFDIPVNLLSISNE